MIVRTKSPPWLINLNKEPPLWGLPLEGPKGEFWRYVPFTVSGRIGTVKGNLALIFTRVKQAGQPIKEGILPPKAFAPLLGILTRVENLDQFYLWGAKISFIDCDNLVMLVGENKLEIVVPWE